MATVRGKNDRSRGPDGAFIQNLAGLKEKAASTVSVVIPALNEAETIGPIVSSIAATFMGERPLVDELVVIDGGSRDTTSAVARSSGATVYSLDDAGPPLDCSGKGAAMWKAQFVTTGDIIVYLDADIVSFDPCIVASLAGPLLRDDEVYHVRASYRRPLVVEGISLDDYGGRITELLIKPLLRLIVPELSVVVQPLGGEYAFRRDALEQLSFSSGYGVEIGLLVDFYARFGMTRFAQVDTGQRVHRNRPVSELGAVATQIARVLLEKLQRHGYLSLADDRNLIMHGMAAGSNREIELGPRSLQAAASERW
ncbi:MAG: glucosyl-3-phosphoglycerate synthase [Chitinispirillaceae bacterium]|nr:glucosyl-3-phosphoglycerate synthase [Chitinispirillaceae bacterium]